MHTIDLHANFILQINGLSRNDAVDTMVLTIDNAGLVTIEAMEDLPTSYRVMIQTTPAKVAEVLHSIKHITKLDPCKNLNS